MRSLSRINANGSRAKAALLMGIFMEGAWTLGCGGGSASPPPSPAPPPTPAVTVSVSPANTNVVLGGQAMFTATVFNTTDTIVNWSVNGVPGGNSGLGTITSAGVYTAPADMPLSATVQVTATSQADPTKSGTASLVIYGDISLALTPNPASVELGATQAFQASVSSNGHPDAAIRWSLSGSACAAGCGAVDTSGKY